MVRVGLVGYGLAGAQFHAPMLQAAGLEVAGVVTRDAARVAQVTRQLPRAVVLPDVPSLLAQPGIELVVVASPSGRHLEHAAAALAAGIGVVVDKPLAVDAPSARHLVATARRGGIPLTVFQNRRYDPEFATVRDLVEAEALGSLRGAELRWERWRPVGLDRWRERLPPAEGGGLLLDLGTHLVDQAVLLLGPVAAVYAQVRSWTTLAEDYAFLVLHHVGGLVTQVTMSSVAGAPGPRWRVTGSDGTFVLGSAGAEPSAFPDADGPPGQHGWVVRGERREPVRARVADPVDFYRQVAVALGSAHPQEGMPVDPDDAVHVLAVLDAARVSARERRAVDVAVGPEPSA